MEEIQVGPVHILINKVLRLKPMNCGSIVGLNKVTIWSGVFLIWSNLDWHDRIYDQTCNPSTWIRSLIFFSSYGQNDIVSIWIHFNFRNPIYLYCSPTSHSFLSLWHHAFHQQRCLEPQVSPTIFFPILLYFSFLGVILS